MSYFYDDYEAYYEDGYDLGFEEDDSFEPDYSDYVDRIAPRYSHCRLCVDNPDHYYDNSADPDWAMWYPIPGHPNHQVSLHGEVRHKRKKNILKPQIDKDGYCRMSLGNKDNVPIHRVACMAFYGIPEDERMQTNHLDCNRQNNHYMNLQWTTPSGNIKWGVDHGNIDPMKGLRKATEANLKPVRIVETGQIFASVRACAEYLGTHPNRISRVLVGERKGQRIHGYHIEFVNKEEM